MKLKILRKLEGHLTGDYVCEHEGKEIKVDLLVNGSMPEEYEDTDLTGYTIEVDSLHPYLYLAMGDTEFTVSK